MSDVKKYITKREKRDKKFAAGYDDHNTMFERLLTLPIHLIHFITI